MVIKGWFDVRKPDALAEEALWMEVANKIRQVMDNDALFAEIFICDDKAEYFDAIEVMCEVSRSFPGLEIALYVKEFEGKDFVIYFLDGKYQSVYPTTVFGPSQPNKWKSHQEANHG